MPEPFYGLNPALFVDLYEGRTSLRTLAKTYRFDFDAIKDELWFHRITQGSPSAEDFLQSVRAKTALGFSEVALPAIIKDLQTQTTQPKERLTASQQLAEMSGILTKAPINTATGNGFQFTINLGPAASVTAQSIPIDVTPTPTPTATPGATLPLPLTNPTALRTNDELTANID
jgi:hypothetical protein